MSYARSGLATTRLIPISNTYPHHASGSSLSSTTQHTTTQVLGSHAPMPYNTRRKSVSLSSLGVHVPKSLSSSASAHRSPPATATSLATENQPPQKKLKRSHSAQEPSPKLSDPSSAPNYKQTQSRAFDTPPPSPGGGSRHCKIETEGINDDIVVAVIEQLERTANRPHLLKELAAILSNHIPIVQRYPIQPPPSPLHPLLTFPPALRINQPLSPHACRPL